MIGLGAMGLQFARHMLHKGFDVTGYDIDADASPDDIKALVAQSQKRSAVYDILTNPTNVSVQVR